MKIESATNKFLAIAFLLAAFLGLQLAAAQVQPPIVVVTWSAQSYALSSYNGKIFPAANSPVTASLLLIENGKPVNLAGQTIYWYLNNSLVNNSGVQKITFTAPSASGIMSLQVRLPDYKSSPIIKTVQIPAASPIAVIDAPYPNKEVVGKTIALKAAPYFFGVKNPSELSFDWSVNGEKPQSAENPAELVVNLNPDAPIGSGINIYLRITNPKNTEESVSQSVRLKLR